MITRRITAAIFSPFMAAFAVAHDVKAEGTDLSCAWEKTDAPELLVDPGAKIAHDFLTDRRMPLRLSIDPQLGSVSHPDPKDVQALLIPRMRIHPNAAEITVVLDEPQWKATLNRNTKVTIHIDRYTLKATAALEMASTPNGKLSAYWVISGKCSKKAL